MFTSFITAFQLACSMTRKNFTGMTIADNSDNTHTIFEDKAKYPYNNLPDNLKPTEKYNNRQELHFATLNSRWRISTAGNKEVGRSKTIRFFHGSEAGFWDSIRKVMVGLGQSLSKKSIKILESTANGVNEYKKLWDDAIKSENNWIPLFFEWWKTPEYTQNFSSATQKDEFVQKITNANDDTSTIFGKLKWLSGYANLTYEQLFWYYLKYKDLGDMLPQEYPCTAHEAFIATGSNVFDTEKLYKRVAELEKHYAINPPKRGKISYVYDSDLQVILLDSIKFIECANGNLTIYETPKNGFPYVIGGDIAEGGIDYSSAHVINNITGNEAAVFHERIDTDLYAKEMFCLGYLYNKALIGIEVNFDKHPIKELQRLRYPNIYYRETIDSITSEKQQKYGFVTTSNTRPILIDKLIELVRDNVNLINHIDELREMLVFVRDEKTRKPQAAEGEHDDLVMGRGISEMVRGQQTVRAVEAIEDIKGVYHYQELIMMGWKPHQIKRAMKNAKTIVQTEEVYTTHTRGKETYKVREVVEKYTEEFTVIGVPD